MFAAGKYRAALLALIMFPGSIAIGFLSAGWIVITAIMVLNDEGLSSLARIPRNHWIVPETPTWLDGTEKTWWTIGVFLAIIVAGISGKFCTDLWRHLVVKKFGWMTHEEVDAFLKRDPGY